MVIKKMESSNGKTSRSGLRRLGAALSLLLVTLLLSLSLVACGSDNLNDTRSLLTTTQAATTVAGTTQAATNAATTAAASNAATTAATSQQSQQVSQPGAPVAQTATDQAESNSVVDVVKRINPAVVTVYNKTNHVPIRGQVPGNNRATPTPSTGNDGQSGSYVVQGIGSGVIISADGYIVTNNHVVDGQDNLTVALNDGKTTVPAKLIGKDKLGDIAVLKIDAPVPAYAKWADRVDVGETVVAIGSALGNFRNSVSKGVISGLNRTLPGDTSTTAYLQTDAAINHGNSGGPLLNLRGEIVGINTAVVRSTGEGQSGSTDVAEGLGFAIPASVAKLLADQLVSKGQVSRPYFGITYQMITPADAGSLTASGRTVPNVEGAWVNRTGSNQPSVVAASPAEKAGLKDNDVITAIDGVPLNDNNPLVNVILKYKPNDTVKLTVQRGTQTLTLNLTLGERPADS